MDQLNYNRIREEENFLETNLSNLYGKAIVGRLHRLMIELFGEKNEDPQINELMAEVSSKYHSEIDEIFDALENLSHNLPRGFEDRIAEMFYRIVDFMDKEIPIAVSQFDNLSDFILLGIEKNKNEGEE